MRPDPACTGRSASTSPCGCRSVPTRRATGSASGLLRLVRDLAEVWFRKADRIVFHDPLAAVSVFEPEVCRFARGAVAIDLDAAPGRTGWTPAPDGPHEVAVEVDPSRFKEVFFGAFGVV